MRKKQLEPFLVNRRNDAMRYMQREGHSITNIARMFNMSKSRASVILGDK